MVKCMLMVVTVVVVLVLEVVVSVLLEAANKQYSSICAWMFAGFHRGADLCYCVPSNLMHCRQFLGRSYVKLRQDWPEKQFPDFSLLYLFLTFECPFNVCFKLHVKLTSFASPLASLFGLRNDRLWHDLVMFIRDWVVHIYSYNNFNSIFLLLKWDGMIAQWTEH
jgi:hypothetical protein